MIYCVINCLKCDQVSFLSILRILIEAPVLEYTNGFNCTDESQAIHYHFYVWPHAGFSCVSDLEKVLHLGIPY